MAQVHGVERDLWYARIADYSVFQKLNLAVP